MKKYHELEKCLDYQFKNKDLIIEALTHKSYKKVFNNERLEYLGDAVLNLIVGEFLFNKFPASNEGELSKIRASLVNEKGFTKLALAINLGDYIYLSEAEDRNQGRKKASILSDAFEAIMGAIYIESGLTVLKPMILKLLDENYEEINLNELFSDYKTALQEVTQAKFGAIPVYKLESAIGPDHEKEFELSLWINDKHYATAKGKSKKLAQQAAAKIVLNQLQGKK
ncbi:ribonuclease III [Arcobacter sp. 15-2]|uniref:ribonuclease III n=1 Tax=Arcobacter sp. 15-2 TaxID=3374109 RepID=UPI00399C849B